MSSTFELQVYQGGVWKLDSLYDDKAIAVDTAKRLFEGRRAPAVRVVEEQFDDAGNSRTNVVFRQSQVEESNQTALKQQAAVRREVEEQRKARRGGGPAPTAVETVGFMRYLVRLAVILGLGAALLVGLKLAILSS